MRTIATLLILSLIACDEAPTDNGSDDSSVTTEAAPIYEAFTVSAGEVGVVEVGGIWQVDRCGVADGMTYCRPEASFGELDFYAIDGILCEVSQTADDWPCEIGLPSSVPSDSGAYMRVSTVH